MRRLARRCRDYFGQKPPLADHRRISVTNSSCDSGGVARLSPGAQAQLTRTSFSTCRAIPTGRRLPFRAVSVSVAHISAGVLSPQLMGRGAMCQSSAPGMPAMLAF